MKKKAPRRTGKAKLLKKRAPKKGDFDLKPPMEVETPQEGNLTAEEQKKKEEEELRAFVNDF
jgi:hypothetical protein